MKKRWPVAVLGATGAVGQAFVRLLVDHPWFELRELAASDRSAGNRYGDSVRWLEGELPQSIASQTVLACDPAQIHSPLVFSALGAGVAGDIESAFARAGKLVLSNAKTYRMDPDVPLVIPEVNGDHLRILPVQRRRRAWTGAIVTNANCAATVAALALAPLHERYKVRQLFISTMQAVSGAGYPGVPSLDIVGNVIPYISEEEDKIERELCKLLGEASDSGIQLAAFTVSAHANRVPVEHGHTVCISAAFETPVSPGDAIDTLRAWRGNDSVRGLPTAPEHALVVLEDRDRPQPRRDVDVGKGMTVSIGRVRPDPLLDVRLVAMGHNIIRGAAGGSLLNAELLVRMDALQPA